ncbi:3-oxoacyl-ACP synthase [Rhodococcus sp. BGS-1C]|uniref:3-oxoacyl-ACP synthase n=1 Tax=Nocardiaceae TaxID=85025 RepID=UPI0019CFF810|nr:MULTISPECIES: 3-oxoacyl-ACP synthase [Rhodococcus]MCC8927548.1 3-oxoacyl-ACP synthase [Rhodococcus sp. I2R]MCZ4275966.1 3-oxoacyl-ACP synthase [Rhodococcus yunnanensis]
MGTVIERMVVTRAGWLHRHSALQVAVTAAKNCLERAGREAGDLDLLINAGLYRDRNLGEPALAALIQEDVGAHPENPHPDAHGTFSFDVANGTCGVLTALQIVDGFLRSGTIEHALVVASDADPGRNLSEGFPFTAAGGAVLCRWIDGEPGLGHVSWVNTPDGGESFRATVGQVDTGNVLRITESDVLDERYADAAVAALTECLRRESLRLSDVDSIVAAPARPAFRLALAERLGIAETRITVGDDESMHTAALVAGLDRGRHHRMPAGTRTLVVAAGASVTAGAALYTEPPVTSSNGSASNG